MKSLILYSKHLYDDFKYIFSKDIISRNTKCGKQILKFIWNTLKYWLNVTDKESLPVFAQFTWTLNFIFSSSNGKFFWLFISSATQKGLQYTENYSCTRFKSIKNWNCSIYWWISSEAFIHLFINQFVERHWNPNAQMSYKIWVSRDITYTADKMYHWYLGYMLLSICNTG